MIGPGTFNPKQQPSHTATLSKAGATQSHAGVTLSGDEYFVRLDQVKPSQSSINSDLTFTGGGQKIDTMIDELGKRYRSDKVTKDNADEKQWTAISNQLKTQSTDDAFNVSIIDGEITSWDNRRPTAVFRASRNHVPMVKIRVQKMNLL